MKISSWAEEAQKRATGQAGFRKEHRTTDHLITLRVLMDECRLRGRTLFCCFVDFKKAFDTIPRGLWKRMQEIRVPFALRVGISCIYEKVLCRLKKAPCMSNVFESNMGVKQGCPYGLCNRGWGWLFPNYLL